MGKRKKYNYWNPIKANSYDDSAYLNNTTYIDYFERMREIWLNLFKWENLPAEINRRFLELTLFERGAISFFHDEIFGFTTLPFTQIGSPDIYGEPIRIRANSNTGYIRELNTAERVIIYNNYSRTIPVNTIKLFAYRLYEIQRSIDVNISNQKTPKIVGTPESQRLTFENFFKNIQGNVPVVFVDDTIDTECIKSFDLTVPFTTDKMDIHKNMVWNEFLTWCGIENSNQDKKERLVADEVGSNYGNVEISRNTCLQARQNACEEINKRFNLNVSVRFNSDLCTHLNSPGLFFNMEKGGGEHE